MPTYTYACKQCDHRFDQRQSFSDPALTVCPQCAGRLRKVLSSVGIVFKGSGFYRTDSRSGGSSVGAKTPAAAGKGQSGSTDSSGSAKKDNGKPASSTDAGSTKSAATPKQPVATGS
jgi:putative FmdB family regulatory protein